MGKWALFRYLCLMATARLSPLAFAMWEQLADDPRRHRLFHRIESILDELERDPGRAFLRRRRFQDPPLWCVIVISGREEWVILWGDDSEHAGDVLVDYIGPASFA